jgi:hypothetical protein
MYSLASEILVGDVRVVATLADIGIGKMSQDRMDFQKILENPVDCEKCGGTK